VICIGLPAFGHSQETVNFKDFLTEILSKSQKIITENGKQKTITGVKLAEVCDVDNDPAAARVFADYGAIFVAAGVLFPFKCIFQNEAEVRFYQDTARSKSAELGGVWIELQEAAMNALLEAQKEAAKNNLKITPRGGSEAAKRSYETTLRLWNSRFFPALNYWVGKGKISRRDAEAARAMQTNAQVAQVLKWEEKKLWFSKDLSKSILYSVAAPGASQHIFMLALDVEQYGNKQVRDILAAHGWFQTVKSDLPHFTYLGLKKVDLPKYGLKSETLSGQEFWIPNWVK
jgi:hypothetical protein